MYWNRTGAEWETVPSSMDQEGYLVCNTDHLSTWAVAEIEDVTAAEDAAEAMQNGIDTVYIYAGIAAIAIIILTAGLYLRAKRK